MSIVGDLVKGVVASALNEILKKTLGGTSKRRRRRNAGASATIEREVKKALRPAKRQASRKKTVRARAKTKRSSS